MGIKRIAAIATAIFTVVLTATLYAGSPLQAKYDHKRGHIEITDSGNPVLLYNHGTVPVPRGFLDGTSKNNRKYARPRSNYIHPLYGSHGEELTADWNRDHPHHRGIYWAWPEVGYQGELGDLHALQHVRARPRGSVAIEKGTNWIDITAFSEWMWEEKTPIVRERVIIRVWQSGKYGRHIDLSLKFTALDDGITLARRNTDKYGGLNIRMAPIEDMKLIHHVDPPSPNSCMAWQCVSGLWKGATQPALLAVFEKCTNPHYPGDYVKYEHLPWFQPTFPQAGQRYELKRDEPLLLNYRFWVSDGQDISTRQCRQQWLDFNR